MVFMWFVFGIGFGFIALALVRLSQGRHRGDGGDEEGGGGDNGPPRRRRGPRPPGPRSPEPSWWPEFEREFRVYASTDNSRRKLTQANT